MDRVSTAPVTVVRPRRSLHSAGLLSFFFVSVVLFGVLYWLAAENGTIAPIVVAHGVFVGICAFIYVRYQRLSFIIRGDQIIERHMFRLHSTISIDDISQVVIAKTYQTQSVETVRQLLALDSDGKRLFRMRGQFWTKAAVEEIALACRARVVRLQTPMSQQEFFEEFPTARYWFQSRRAIVAGSGVALMAGIAMAVGIMNVVSSRA